MLPLTQLLDGPVEDPVLIFALAMIIFLTAPLLLERYRLPGIIGIILVGAAIGPNGLGVLARDETIVLLGQVGLIYLMFVAGLEINLNRFIENRDQSAVFGTLSFLIPQAIGTVFGVWVLGLSVPAALLFASIFASHTLLAYPIVNRLGIAKNGAMTAAIGGTILTDTLALLVLAVVVAAEQGVLGPGFWTQLTVGLTAFFVGVWVLVPRIGRWFFRNLAEESYFEFLFVMAILFVCAYLAEVVGVEAIIGAFLAGLVLNRLIPETGPLMNRIEFVGNALFIPFFLLSVGMLVDVGLTLESAATLMIGVSLVVLVIATKFVSAWLTGRIYDFSRDEVLGMFGLSVGQAAAALAIVLIGFDVGIPGFDQHMINGVVLMILVVSVISPIVVQRAGLALVSEREREAYDPRAAPQRILVPFSPDSNRKGNLLDLALLLRDGRDEEPLYTVTVVDDRSGTEPEAAIAEVEASLTEAERYVATAEVPVNSQTRVDTNPASGIVRTVVENRITTLVIGWDGRRSRRQTVFGSVIDQVLRRTDQLVFVARVREPLNTTQRVVVILPPGIDHNPGFYEAMHNVKLLAERSGTPIHGLVVGGNPDQFSRLVDLVEPTTAATFESVEDWGALDSVLRDGVSADDFVVCLSSRRDRPGWHPELQTLPKRISTIGDHNFVIVYPATKLRTDDRRFLRIV